MKPLPKGGKRGRAGRPLKSGTHRISITWRLPIHLLTRIYKNAEFEGISVTAWVERALERELGQPLTAGYPNSTL
jgi:hypothetical protein